MSTSTHQSQHLATIASSLEAMARTRGVRVRRLTIAVPESARHDALGPALRRRLEARGLAGVDVQVVVEPGEVRVVAVEYERR